MEKSKVIEKLFTYVVTYSYLILPVLFIITRPKRRESQILALYGIVFFFLLFLFKYIHSDYWNIYNSTYTFLEYSFFSSLFYLNFTTKKFKRLIVYFSIAFYVFQIIHFLTIDNYRIDSVPIGVESILIFIYIFLFLYENIKSPKQDFVYNDFLFWISVGLLIYLGGSFFVNILANSMTPEEFDKYWYLNFIADTVKTLFFAGAMILLTKSSSKSSNKDSRIPFLDMI